MADDTTTTPPAAAPPAATPPPASNAAELAQLAAKIEAANAQLSASQKLADALKVERDGFKTQAETLATQFEAASQKLTAAEALGQSLQSQVKELANVQADTGPMLQLYNLIASTPEYHGLIGSAGAIKTVPDIEAQKAILSTVAGAVTNNAAAQIQALQAGGTFAQSNGAGGPQTPGTQQQGPKSAVEAFQMAYQFAGKNKAEFDKYMSLAQTFNKNAEA